LTNYSDKPTGWNVGEFNVINDIRPSHGTENIIRTVLRVRQTFVEFCTQFYRSGR